LAVGNRTPGGQAQGGIFQPKNDPEAGEGGMEEGGGAFQSVELGPGRHHLVFEFGSRGFRLGLGISFAALLACVAVAMKARRRKKPRGMFDSLAEL
jgi:hypothetical protein